MSKQSISLLLVAATDKGEPVEVVFELMQALADEFAKEQGEDAVQVLEMRMRANQLVPLFGMHVGAQISWRVYRSKFSPLRRSLLPISAPKQWLLDWSNEMKARGRDLASGKLSL